MLLLQLVLLLLCCCCCVCLVVGWDMASDSFVLKGHEPLHFVPPLISLLPLLFLSLTLSLLSPSHLQQQQPCYVVFDIVFLNDENLCTKPLNERLRILETVFKTVPGHMVMAHRVVCWLLLLCVAVAAVVVIGVVFLNDENLCTSSLNLRQCSRSVRQLLLLLLLLLLTCLFYLNLIL
jgi:hypothetical protein